jgi:hypothetical protein
MTKFITFIGGIEEKQIVIFPSSIQHSDFANAVKALSYEKLRTISGGFVVNGECVGKSISLGMKSRGKADTILLKNLQKG